MTPAKNIQSVEEYKHCLGQRFVQARSCHRLHLYHTEQGWLNCWYENVQPPILNGLTGNRGNRW